jgi:predicted lipid-binding transport protein (Tim44 family)
VPRRSWLGPIAGLAAGLGIAALMSHLGFGAEFGNIVMLLLLGIVAIVAIRFVMSRFASGRSAPDLRFASAGPSSAAFPGFASGGSAGGSSNGLGNAGSAAALAPTGLLASPATSAASASRWPADFDAAAFERVAKMIFIRLQAANDSGDLGDLRAFTTPEMFAHLKLDLQERGAAAQQTDVERVDAEVLDVAREPDRQIVSVRFHGLIREQAGAPAEPFDEVWHLVKPADASREWAIAGIQPSTPQLAHAA